MSLAHIKVDPNLLKREMQRLHCIDSVAGAKPGFIRPTDLVIATPATQWILYRRLNRIGTGIGIGPFWSFKMRTAMIMRLLEA